MDVKIPELLTNLIGQKCFDARVGYGGTLVLYFGENVNYTKETSEEYSVEWNLRTDSCSWRLDRNDNVICGSYDEEEENDRLLQSLVSLKLLRIENNVSPDIVLEFENKYIVYLMGQSKDSDHFGIFAPGDVHLGFNPITKWNIMPSNLTGDELSEKEKLLSIHSEGCFKRWEVLIPEGENEKYCDKCIYYRPLRGEFYFWDYGICSNEISQYDGKLVGCRSGCTRYSEDFKNKPEIT